MFTNVGEMPFALSFDWMDSNSAWDKFTVGIFTNVASPPARFTFPETLMYFTPIAAVFSMASKSENFWNV